MSDMPRTSRDALKAQGELVRKSYKDKIARLRVRAPAAQKDAERYRWLRESCCGKNPDITAIIEANEILLDADEMTFEQLDAAIDAAMGEKK